MSGPNIMVQVPFNILRTYRYKNFYVDICGVDNYEAWLYRKDYGKKMFMLGCPFDSCTLDQFVELVYVNIDNYIEYFEDEER